MSGIGDLGLLTTELSFVSTIKHMYLTKKCIRCADAFFFTRAFRPVYNYIDQLLSDGLF